MIELLALLQKKYPSLDEEFLQLFLQYFFKNIASSLGQGHRIELRKFGVFSIKEMGEKDLFVPRLGVKIKKEKSYLPKFKSSAKISL